MTAQTSLAQRPATEPEAARSSIDSACYVLSAHGDPTSAGLTFVESTSDQYVHMNMYLTTLMLAARPVIGSSVHVEAGALNTDQLCTLADAAT
jgi:hypothetical protein